MINNKIAIFLDIDGTLYDSKIKDLQPSSIKIINELALDPQVDLYIASGRSMNTINNIKKYFHAFRGFVLTNGQEIYIDGKTFYEGAISYDLTMKLLNYCNKHHYSMVLLNDDRLYYNMFNVEVKKNFELYIKEKVYPITDELDIQSMRIPQIWLFTTNEENEKIRYDFPELTIIDWGNSGADVLPKGMSKGIGVENVIKHLGYKLENTYAIGDSDNDVVMFEKVGTSICMGNGTIKAKNAAMIVGYSIDDDGLSKNIKKYILKK